MCQGTKEKMVRVHSRESATIPAMELTLCWGTREENPPYKTELAVISSSVQLDHINPFPHLGHQPSEPPLSPPNIGPQYSQLSALPLPNSSFDTYHRLNQQPSTFPQYLGMDPQLSQLFYTSLSSRITANSMES